MSKQIFNPQPNYSGVTIQIANPAVNVNPYGANCPQNEIRMNTGNSTFAENQAITFPYNDINNPNGQFLTQNNPQNRAISPYLTQYGTNGRPYHNGLNSQTKGIIPGNSNAVQQDTGFNQAYPAGYYINNYNVPPKATKTILEGNANNTASNNGKSGNVNSPNYTDERNINPEVTNLYKDYADTIKIKTPEDMTASNNIINDLNERNAEIKEANKNTKEQKVFALTDEYIKSLENYLDNPNDELRLMASKEVLTRLDEDKDRYDDAALNALLNKMLQDPSKLVRLAALSAFASQLASGNDYTVQLLQNIQSDPNGDKEDALQAADILLKMSAGVEVKNVPVTEEEKRKVYKMKQRVSG